MKEKGKKIYEDLRRYLSAISFAEAGEFDKAREFLGKRPKSQVLLFVEGDELNPQALEYSIEASVRNKNGLRVLIWLSSPINRLANFNQTISKVVKLLSNIKEMVSSKGIEPWITLEIGDEKDFILSHLRQNRDIVLMIYDSKELHSVGTPKNKEKLLKEISQRTSVPIFAVSDKQE